MSAAEDLCEYELTRAENIKRNNAFLMALGLMDDAEAMRKKPKVKAPPKPKPEKTESGPARRSSRLDPTLEPEDGAAEEIWSPPETAERDPYVCWWTTDGMRRPPLTAAQERALEVRCANPIAPCQLTQTLSADRVSFPHSRR